MDDGENKGQTEETSIVIKTYQTSQVPADQAPSVLKKALLFSAALAVCLLGLSFYLFAMAGQAASVAESLLLEQALITLHITASSFTVDGLLLIAVAIMLLIHSGLLLSVLYLNKPAVMVKDTIATLFAEEVDLKYSTVTKFGDTQDWLEVGGTGETTESDLGDVYLEPEDEAKPTAAIPEAGAPAEGAVPAGAPETETAIKRRRKMLARKRKKKKKQRSVKPAYYIPQGDEA